MKRLIVFCLILAAHQPAFASKCGRLLATSLVVANFGVAAAAAAADTGYAPVPTQAERANPASGYVAFPDFPHLELVDPKSGALNHDLMSALSDPELYRRLSRGAFTVLSVRNLYLNKPRVSRPEGQLRLPITVSLQYRKSWRESVCPNGTINVDGLVRVHADGSDLHVTVEHYQDSQPFEAWVRTLGCNTDINLGLAAGVVIPTLEHWLNQDPARIRLLIDLADAS